MMNITQTMLFLLAISILYQYVRVEGKRAFPIHHPVVLERQLKLVNKPALRTIHSEDGDIIDCVDIYKQPAFDNPALINHTTIQMRPSSYPQGIEENDLVIEKDGSSLGVFPQVWHKSGSCPDGTIPIRRIRKSELLRANARNATINTGGAGISSIAILVVYEKEKYYGTHGTINIWTPLVESPDDSSSTQMSLVSGNADDSSINDIQVGWMVNPSRYGDKRTRFYIHWTRDSDETTGCFDLRCSGFVQTSKWITLGGAISPISTPSGDQYEDRILVSKDPGTGNWLLIVGKNNVQVGYWPSNLFTSLNEGAARVYWGGQVYTKRIGPPHTTTQMGSGKFPNEPDACYIKNMQIVDENNNLKDPEGLVALTTDPKCYTLIDRGNDGSAAGQSLAVGGPGRNPNCP